MKPRTSIIPVHRSSGILPYSWGFLRNAAVFTAEKGLDIGDFYRVSLPTFRIYVITDPALTKHVMVRNQHKYTKSKIYWKQLLKTIGPALGSLEGDEWKALRILHSPYFSQSATKAYLPTVNSVLQQHLEKLKEKEQSIDLVQFFCELNTQSLLKVVFNTESGEETKAIAQAIAEGQKTIYWRSRFPWNPLLSRLNGLQKKSEDHLNFFTHYVKRIIGERPLSPAKPKNLLDGLLKHYGEKQGLTEEAIHQIRNELIVYTGAGTETMALSEAYTLFHLAQNQDKLAKVREEISRVAGDRPLSHEDIPHLEYTRWSVLEGMRLQPSSYALLRDCIEEDELQGQPVYPGDSLFISIYATHRNPRLWKNPLQFIPERFATEELTGDNKYRFMPYGAGKHHCIGAYLATPQMTLTIASVVQKFDLDFMGLNDLNIQSLSTLKPGNKMIVKLRPKDR